MTKQTWSSPTLSVYGRVEEITGSGAEENYFGGIGECTNGGDKFDGDNGQPGDPSLNKSTGGADGFPQQSSQTTGSLCA